MQKVSPRDSNTSKAKNQKQWYKENIDKYDRLSFSSQGPNRFLMTDSNDWIRMKTNFDLMNNVINPRDFDYVTAPWGDHGRELPTPLVNKDIISQNVFTIQGLEMRRPFKWRVAAVNREATTEREQTEFSALRDWVLRELMGEKQEQDPVKIKKYVQRKFQTQAEMLAVHILNYLTRKLNLQDVLNKGMKFATIAGREIYYIGPVMGEPGIRTIHPLFFDHDKSPDVEFIEDGEWCVAEYRMTPTEVVAEFSDELTAQEIDDIYDEYNHEAPDFAFMDEFTNSKYIRVLHVQWKTLKKVGSLTFRDETGEIKKRFVDRGYKLDESIGDIEIKWKYVPDVHEGYKIGSDRYKRLRPVPHQFRDPDHIWNRKLSYYGATYNFDNGRLSSPVDRMKPWQYLINVLWYRVEQAIANDKGKKVFINPSAIPKNDGGRYDDFEYFLETGPYAYLDPSQEGNRGAYDVTQLVKEVDLTGTQTIEYYRNLIEYIENKCAESIGLTPQIKGQIAEREAVRNVNQALALSTNALEPFFKTHDRVKRNVIEALINIAKSIYLTSDKEYLAYVLDDMTYQQIKLDKNLLDLSSYGVFIDDSTRSQDAEQLVTSIAQAGIQNGLIGTAAAIRLAETESTQEAVEILQEEEDAQRQKQMETLQQQQQFEAQMKQAEMQMMERKHEMELEKITLQEEYKTRREIAQQTILAMGFAENKDENANNVPDVVEYSKLLLEKEKIINERTKLELEKEKLKKKPTN